MGDLSQAEFEALQKKLYHIHICEGLVKCKWDTLSDSQRLGWADVARYFIAQGSNKAQLKSKLTALRTENKALSSDYGKIVEELAKLEKENEIIRLAFKLVKSGKEMILGYYKSEHGSLEWDCSFGTPVAMSEKNCVYEDTALLAIQKAILKQEAGLDEK